MLKANTLDLMLCEGGLEPRQWPAVEVWRGPLTDALYEHIPCYVRRKTRGDCPTAPPSPFEDTRPDDEASDKGYNEGRLAFRRYFAKYGPNVKQNDPRMPPNPYVGYYGVRGSTGSSLTAPPRRVYPKHGRTSGHRRPASLSLNALPSSCGHKEPAQGPRERRDSLHRPIGVSPRPSSARIAARRRSSSLPEPRPCACLRSYVRAERETRRCRSESRRGSAHLVNFGLSSESAMCRRCSGTTTYPLRSGS